MDSEKQRNYWLFLGEYTPENKPTHDLWDIDPAEKDADEQIYKNSIDNYVNTSQERLSVSEGRLKKLTLLEFSSYHPLQNLDFHMYFKDELQFNRPLLLSPSLLNQAARRSRLTSLIVIEKSPDARKPSMFALLDQMTDYAKTENALWSNYRRISENK